MTTTHKTLIQQALEAIFDAKSNAMPPTTKFDTDTVRITRTAIAPDQFRALADFCQYLGQWPTLVRSGAYTAIVFAC